MRLRLLLAWFTALLLCSCALTPAEKGLGDSRSLLDSAAEAYFDHREDPALAIKKSRRVVNKKKIAIAVTSVNITMTGISIVGVGGKGSHRVVCRLSETARKRVGKNPDAIEVAGVYVIRGRLKEFDNDDDALGYYSTNVFVFEPCDLKPIRPASQPSETETAARFTPRTLAKEDHKALARNR